MDWRKSVWLFPRFPRKMGPLSSQLTALDPYRDGKHDSEKHRYLEGDWQVLEQGSEKLTNSLSNMLQRVCNKSGDGHSDGL